MIVHLRRDRTSAGFTLLELMVVVVLIGVMVTLAVPSIAQQMRDRRTNQAAHEVALLFRQARARAMGRGAAVLVRFDSGTVPRGTVEVREAQDIDPLHCLSLPATSCSQTNWAAANPQNRLVQSFNPTSAFTNVQLAFFNANGGAAGNAVDICFSPLGRPYRRFAFTGAFTPLNEIPYLQATPIDGAGITRTVLIVPNGASRLAL